MARNESFYKEVLRKLMFLREGGGTQNKRSGLGGARARNESFYKEKHRENCRFLRGGKGGLKMRNLALWCQG